MPFSARRDSRESIISQPLAAQCLLRAMRRVRRQGSSPASSRRPPPGRRGPLRETSSRGSHRPVDLFLVISSADRPTGSFPGNKVNGTVIPAIPQGFLPPCSFGTLSNGNRVNGCSDTIIEFTKILIKCLATDAIQCVLSSSEHRN